MSLIHEALEKLEKEKTGPAEFDQTESAPKLNPRVTPLPRKEEKAGPSENNRLIFAVGGAVFLLFVVGLVYLTGRSLSSSSPLPESRNAPEPARRGSFVLTGITGSEQNLIAVVNNQLVRVGERVGEARVVEIQSDRVLLDANGRQITLTL